MSLGSISCTAPDRNSTTRNNQISLITIEPGWGLFISGDKSKYIIKLNSIKSAQYGLDLKITGNPEAFSSVFATLGANQATENNADNLNPVIVSSSEIKLILIDDELYDLSNINIKDNQFIKRYN